MRHQKRRIMIHTDVIDIKNRIDELISQFNGWMKDNEKPTSLSLHFYTSEEYPLTMGEVAHFLNSTTAIIDGCNIEWSSETDETLNQQIVIEIIFNNK